MLSIAYGVIAGILSYVLLNGIPWALRKATGGRLVPPDYDLAEQWSAPPGGLQPGWLRMLRQRGQPRDAQPGAHAEVPMGETRSQTAPSPDPSKEGAKE